MKDRYTLKFLLPLSAFCAVVVGCAESADHAQTAHIAPTTQEVPATEEEAREHVEEILATLSSGGQPGKISLSGAIVTKDSSGELIYDARLKVEQKGGLNLQNEAATVSEENKVELQQNLSETQTKNLEIEPKTYINLGCELNDTEVAGLTRDENTDDGVPLNDVPAGELVFKKASKIFICGPQQTPSLNTVLYARELILKDAELSLESDNMGGGLAITAAEVTLQGANKIVSKGMNSSADQIMEASDLHFAVANKLSGEGSLSLESIGGNRLSTMEEAKADSQD